MKEFIVKSGDKQFKVKAADYESAIAAVRAVSAKDDATQLDVIQALVTDEQAAIAAYTNAIANLDGKVDPQYIEVLRNILKEENKHVENLQAIVTGNVTEKNVEDSVKDDASYAANLAEELASTLRRNKLDLAQKILRLLTNSCKQLGLSVIDSVKDAAYGYVVIRNTNEQQDFGLRFGIKLQNQIDWKNWRRVEVLTEAAAKEIERAGYIVHRY